MKIVIDTSIYINFLRTSKGLFPEIVNKSVIYTPTIVVLELYAGGSASNTKVIEQIKRLIGPTKIIDLTRQISETAGNLLRDKSVLDPEDAIIAATALYLDAELATENKKHFSKVKGLKLFNAQKSSS